MSQPDRFEMGAEGQSVVLIPYDTYIAALMFLSCGRAESEVLPLLGLNSKEWASLHAAYRWFHSHLGQSERDRYLGSLQESQVAQAILQPRWQFPENAPSPPNLRSTVTVREATLRNPLIGPFSAVAWRAHYLGSHPEATLIHYLHDGEKVYFDGVPLHTKDGTPLRADAPSFRLLGGRWMRDEKKVYAQGLLGGRVETFYWYEVEGADTESFQALNLRYAKDKNKAYYISQKTIRSQSPAAFEIVPELRLNYRDGEVEPLWDSSVFARDHEHVYHFGQRLKGAKPAHFRNLGHGYATDGERVWYMENRKELPMAEATTFLVPRPGEPYVDGNPIALATDRHRPFRGHEPLDPKENVETWRAFFEHRTDLNGWWWHSLAKR